MPYLLLVLGLIIGVYGLYRFFLNANIHQIKALGLSVFSAIIVISILILALTGRLPAALALVMALVPIVIARQRSKKENPQGAAPSSSTMSEKEAFEVLGLAPGADEAAIDAAYKKLMQKVHPDSQGTDWMAAKLNQARDILLKK